jgi:hypothetical protein
MCFFLKSIDVWKIVEIGWIKPEATIAKLFVAQNSAWLSNDKAFHALCQALSPSEFTRISNCESNKDEWKILKTTYEGTKLVKSAKHQMLISRFEDVREWDIWWVLHQDQRLEKLDGESWEEGLWCKTHQKDSKVFARAFQDQSDFHWRKQGLRFYEDWRVGVISLKLWVFPTPSQESKGDGLQND